LSETGAEGASDMMRRTVRRVGWTAAIEPVFVAQLDGLRKKRNESGSVQSKYRRVDAQSLYGGDAA
jgi:hypothetical protein